MAICNKFLLHFCEEANGSLSAFADCKFQEHVTKEIEK
jgi:hypothetical protein